MSLEKFKELHHQSQPLLIANTWDAISSKAAEKAGFQVIGTSSHAIANILGLEDGEIIPFNEMFFITKKSIDGEPLIDPLVLRPTSEILFCYYFKDMLVSYNQLPFKYNQWANVFRVEKNTRPFLRTSEFYWTEMHSIHSTKKEAEEFTLIMNDNFEDRKMYLSLYSLFFIWYFSKNII